MVEQNTAEPSPTPPVTKDSPKTSGSGCLRTFVLAVILFGAALFGTLKGVQYYSVNCQGMSVSDCIIYKEPTPYPSEDNNHTTVQATGPYSYEGHSISMSINIPLQGGKVTGTVSGDCTGKVTGSYDGNNNGVISGNINGYCEVTVIPVPAKATFQGTVNKESKTVPISFEGNAAGFTHSGSLSLSYPKN